MDLDEAKRRLAFFSNAGRDDREIWTVRNWLKAKFPSKNFSIVKGANPPDFLIDGTMSVEVTEVMEEGRRRSDEYKDDLIPIQNGSQIPNEQNIFIRSNINEKGIEWIINSIDSKKNKYTIIDTSSWTLVIYANFFIFESFDWEKLGQEVSELKPPFSQVDIFIPGNNEVRNIYSSEN